MEKLTASISVEKIANKSNIVQELNNAYQHFK